MAKGKILVVFHEPILGGATISVVRAVPRLERLGWSFSFWVPKPSALFDDLRSRGWDVDGAPRYIDHSLRALRLPPGPLRRASSVPGYARTFSNHVSALQPDLVHANTVTTFTEAIIAKRRGVPALVHVHEMVPDDRRGALVKRLSHSYLDGVVAVSKACAEQASWRGTKPWLVHEAAEVPEHPAETRDRPVPFVVGTVGVISRRKGSDLFVEAAEKLVAKSDRFRFEMIGGSIAPREAAWGHGVIARAEQAGIAYFPSADVEARMRTWDAFALASRADPFPIALLEAMALGLPVVGARRDGIAEQLDGDAGILVDPEDASSLAHGIAQLAECSGAERADLASRGRARVQQYFTIQRQAEGLDDVYRQIVDRS